MTTSLTLHRTKAIVLGVISALYMLVVSEVLRHASIIHSQWLFGLLGMFRFSVAFVPLCILAAASRLRIGALLVYYIILLYVAIIGGALLGHEQLAFDVAPGVRVTWQVQAVNSFFFLLIFGVLNLVPVGITWGLATAFFSQARHRTAKHP